MQKILFTCATLLISNSLYASIHEFRIFDQCYHPVVTAGFGASVAGSSGPSRDFPILDPVTDEFYFYSGKHNQNIKTVGNFFVGLETNVNALWLFQAGISGYQSGSYDIKGHFLQGADQQSSDEYDYRYELKNFQVLVEGKLLYTYRGFLHPYAMLGLGISSNRATHYHTNVPPFLTFTRMYRDHTETSFAYDAGLGVDVDLCQNIRLGVGYKMLNLGYHKLGSATIDTTPVPGHLSRRHFWTNQLWLQGTVLL